MTKCQCSATRIWTRGNVNDGRTAESDGNDGGGIQRHYCPATFAGRPGMTNTRRVAMVATVAMVEFTGKHWPATFSGRPGTNEDDDGDGSGCGGNRNDGV